MCACVSVCVCVVGGQAGAAVGLYSGDREGKEAVPLRLTHMIKSAKVSFHGRKYFSKAALMVFLK